MCLIGLLGRFSKKMHVMWLVQSLWHTESEVILSFYYYCFCYCLSYYGYYSQERLIELIWALLLLTEKNQG